MKISTTRLPTNNKSFHVRECIIGGEECYWVIPDKKERPKWDDNNLIFRSSIWRKSDLSLVSPGLKKFFQFTENPGIDPVRSDIKMSTTQAMEKLDGTCLIISKFKGELIIRTRGSLVSKMANASEIDILKEKYPKVFDNEYLNSENYTLVFEWLSPDNCIIIKHEEPDIKLLTVIKHDDYSYFNQQQVEVIASDLKVPRPVLHYFDSPQQMIEKVSDWENKEGICWYYNDGQCIRKVKSSWYIAVTAAKQDINLRNLTEVFALSNFPSYYPFMEIVNNILEGDDDLLQFATPLVSRILDAYKEVERIIDGMWNFAAKANKNSNRQQKVEYIFDAYGKTNRAGMVINLSDGKQLTKRDVLKLLYQCLK